MGLFHKHNWKTIDHQEFKIRHFPSYYSINEEEKRVVKIIDAYVQECQKCHKLRRKKFIIRCE